MTTKEPYAEKVHVRTMGWMKREDIGANAWEHPNGMVYILPPGRAAMVWINKGDRTCTLPQARVCAPVPRRDWGHSQG